MSNSKNKKTVIVKFSDQEVAFCGSKVEVTCTKTGAVATFLRDTLVKMIKKNYNDNYGMFIANYVKRRNLTAEQQEQLPAVAKKKVKDPILKNRKDSTIKEKSSNKTPKNAKAKIDQENERQPEQYRLWLLLSYREATRANNLDKMAHLESIYWNRYERNIKEDVLEI